MILVIFGNVPLPFWRLAAKVDELSCKMDESFVVQHGHTAYNFRVAECHKFLSGSEMNELMQRASLIITHGGYGTISEALKKEKRIIAVPRVAGEHNHPQVELVEAMEKAEYLLGVYKIEDLEQKIAAARVFSPRAPVRGNPGAIINRYCEKWMS